MPYAGMLLFAGLAGPEVAIVLGEDHRQTARWLALVAALAAALVPWRIMRLSITADGDRLIVRNWVTTITIPVEEIRRFHPPAEYDRYNWFKLGLRVERVKDLPDVYCSGLYANRFTPTFGRAETAELEAWRRVDAYRPPIPRNGKPLGTTLRIAWAVWVALLVLETVAAVAISAIAVIDPTSYFLS